MFVWRDATGSNRGDDGDDGVCVHRQKANFGIEFVCVLHSSLRHIVLGYTATRWCCCRRRRHRDPCRQSTGRFGKRLHDASQVLAQIDLLLPINKHN